MLSANGQMVQTDQIHAILGRREPGNWKSRLQGRVSDLLYIIQAQANALAILRCVQGMAEPF